MIDTMKPYPEYKDSRLQWLGRIPKYWDVIRTKGLFRLSIEKSAAQHGMELLSIYTHIGVRPRKDLEERGNKASTTDGYWIVRKGDLIVNKLLAWMGAVGVSHYEGVTSPAYDILRPRRALNSDYYHYLFRTSTYLQQLKSRSRGIMDMRLRLYFDQLGQIPSLAPPEDEQNAIVAYLDDVFRKTNKFIRNRRRMIEVLNEQKQAIINRAVTRGLDPGVPLKSSDIDWLGDIPEHWEVKSLRQLGRFTKGSGGSREDDVAEGLPCIRYGHIYMYFNFTVSAVRTYVSESRARDYARIKHGDILFTASGEDMSEIGKSVVNLIEEEVCCGGDVIILRPRIVAHSPFLGYASDAWHARCQKARLGRGTTVKHIYGDQLKKVCIAVPPKDEQVAIAEHIRQAISEATSLIDRAKREIDLIREYRARLISDVVTGKMDIRHVASPPGGEDLEEMAEALEPLDDEAGEMDEEALAGEVEQ